MTTPHIRLRRLCKTYSTGSGKRVVLKDVDLEIGLGDRVSLVGPNGSGKSTFLRLIAGVEEPDSGRVEVAGPRRAADASYIPQDYRNALFPWLRLGRNLTLGGGESSARGYPELAKAFRLGVDLTKFPYQLSGGEQQIFLLIRSLLRNPSLLVLDEPWSSVDFRKRRLIQEYLGEWIPNAGATFLLASHDAEEAVMLSDLALVFDPEMGAMRSAVPIDLPWPRKPDVRKTPEFRAAVDRILQASL